MWGLAYRVLKSFFGGSSPLNAGEKDQPPPLEVRRAQALRELHNIDVAIKAQRELKLRIANENNPPD